MLKGVAFQVRGASSSPSWGGRVRGNRHYSIFLGFSIDPTADATSSTAPTTPRADDEERSTARNRKIGFVFQQFHLLERASALRNVTLPLLYAEDEAGDPAVRAQRALEAVGLAHRARHLPGELSGGEQQRVAIARALINDPALILADEPTGNLDAKSGREVLDIFRRLVGAGRTLVLVTHDRAVAERADRILLLDDGRIVGDRPAPVGTHRRALRPSGLPVSLRRAGIDG